MEKFNLDLFNLDVHGFEDKDGDEGGGGDAEAFGKCMETCPKLMGAISNVHYGMWRSARTLRFGGGADLACLSSCPCV